MGKKTLIAFLAASALSIFPAAAQEASNEALNIKTQTITKPIGTGQLRIRYQIPLFYLFDGPDNSMFIMEAVSVEYTDGNGKIILPVDNKWQINGKDETVTYEGDNKTIKVDDTGFFRFKQEGKGYFVVNFAGTRTVIPSEIKHIPVKRNDSYESLVQKLGEPNLKHKFKGISDFKWVDWPNMKIRVEFGKIISCGQGWYMEESFSK